MLVDRRARTWALLLLVNMFWAFQFPAYRVVAETVSAAALSFWTLLIATAVLLPFLIRDRQRDRTVIPRREPLDGLRFVALAGLGVIPPSVGMAWGIAHSNASNASILSLTIPVMMLLMGILMLKERPGRFVILSLALALIGVTLISWEEIAIGNFSGQMLVGNVVIFLSGAGAAFYNAYCKKLLGRYSPVEILVYVYVVGAAMCAAISYFSDSEPFYQVATWSFEAWFGIVVLGAIVWGIAMLLWMWLLNQLELGQISVSVYMLTVFGLIFSALMLGERVNVMQLAGGIIVLSSAYFSSALPKQSVAEDSVT